MATTPIVGTPATPNCVGGSCMSNCGTVQSAGYCQTSTCSNCGTTCGAANSSLCPRCGCTMTAN